VAAQLLFGDEGMAYAARDNAAVVVLRQALTLPRLRWLRENTIKRAAKYGERMGSIVVLEAEAVFDASREVRHESAQLVREFPSMAQARVIEARGFRGVAMRAILNGVTLLGRPKYLNKVFDDVAAAAGWLAETLPAVDGVTRPTAQELLELVDAARRGVRRG
jgi:hypothetical protein